MGTNGMNEIFFINFFDIFDFVSYFYRILIALVSF